MLWSLRGEDTLSHWAQEFRCPKENSIRVGDTSLQSDSWNFKHGLAGSSLSGLG